jgi:DNA-binding response OmpR family regulator
MRILLAGSNAESVSLLEERLVKKAVMADVVGTMEEADAALLTLAYDAVVLDLELSNEDGLALALRMRQRRESPPLLVLSACLDVKDRVAALRGGAADYLTKPFEIVELIARLRALARRPPDIRDRTITKGNVWLKVDRQQMQIEETTFQLSRHEMVLLEALLSKAGHVVPHSILRSRLFGATSEPDSNALEVSMHRLRRRLVRAGATLEVHSVRGVGYVAQMKA